jgi:hypothetical protein
VSVPRRGATGSSRPTSPASSRKGEWNGSALDVDI